MHTPMFESVKQFYDWELYTRDQVKELVPFTITEEECTEILGTEI